MKIIVDAFGGDNAPEEVLKGCVEAMSELGVEILLAGNEKKIFKAANKCGVYDTVSKMQILNCEDSLTMEDEPSSIVDKNKNTSMSVGLRALSSGMGDAFASAGNSGALVYGSTFIVKRIKGIKRVTFAPLMPKSEGFFMLMDGGANNECRPIMLEQFALMGSIYMKNVMGIKNPRVALINVGTEEHKGDALRTETFALLKEQKSLNFVGNVEARDIPYDAADILVTDGFTGNIILKLYEGVAGALMDRIKGVFTQSLKNKLAATMVYSDMRKLKASIDYNEYGGAPIMGAMKPVFKIHGSANARTVKNALRLTKSYVQSGIIETITNSIRPVKADQKV